MDIRFLYLAIGGFFGVLVGAAIQPVWDMAASAMEADQPPAEQLSEQDQAAQDYAVALSMYLVAEKRADEAHARWHDSIHGEKEPPASEETDGSHPMEL